MNVNVEKLKKTNIEMGLILFFTICIVSISDASANTNDLSNKVLLRNVSALTFYDNRMTVGRRTAPIQQLDCVAGDACQFIKPSVVRCYNDGYDGRSVQWRCETTVSDYYKLGKVTVSCEGYERPGDEYVLGKKLRSVPSIVFACKIDKLSN